MSAEKESTVKEDKIRELEEYYYPDLWKVWCHTCVIDMSAEKSSLLPAEVAEEEIHNLEERYRELDRAHDDELVVPLLTDICENVRLDRSMTSTFTFEELVDHFAYDDMLKLYIACSDIENFTGRMFLRCGKRTVSLDNTCNWMQDVMIRSFLKEHLPEHITVKQAERELGEQKQAITGRRHYDIRTPILLLGTYNLIKDTHYMASPMPNNVCEFLLFFLKLCGVNPSRSEVDATWIRSQLRYLLSRESVYYK